MTSIQRAHGGRGSCSHWSKIGIIFQKVRSLITLIQISFKSDNLQYKMLARWDKWLIDQVSDVPCIFFILISCKILCKNRFNLFPIKIKVCKDYEKKIMLGTSDSWWVSCSSQLTTEPYCRLLVKKEIETVSSMKAKFKSSLMMKKLHSERCRARTSRGGRGQ